MEKKESKKLAEEMGISPSTVRTHKFYLQKLKRQSKIFLTIMNLLELQEEEVESKEILKNEKLNDVTDIIDCKILLENPANFRERRMLDFF